MKSGSKLAASLVLCAVACGEPSEPVRVEIDFNHDVEGGVLPRLDDPFSIDETRDMREDFDWSSTTALPETDPDGHIALRYAIAYIGSEEERVLLDAVGPHSPLPMFAVERERWAGQTGRFGFFGDGAGLFHYVVLTAGTYNLLRELALDGRPPFQALILRDPPVAEVDNGDGSLDYQWLGERGFRMNDEPRERAEESEEIAREPFIFELLVTILASRDARDAVDDGFGEITRAFREGTNTVTLVLGSTDSSHGGMTRTWGNAGPPGTNAGSPLTLYDVEVLAQMEVGTQRARTNAAGVATVDVASGASVTFCIRANNFAVQVDEGFEATQACSFRLSSGVTIANAVDGAEITLVVADPVWNIVAQMTDANQYAERVMGHRVSHRAGVLIGAFADLFGAFNGNRAFVLCGGYTSAMTAGWAVVANVISAAPGLFDPSGAWLGVTVVKIMAHDIIFPMHGTMSTPAGAAWSRVVPTHEYGHVLQCDMLSVLGGDGDFTEGWGDIIYTSLFGTQTPTTENLILTEGIADYFAAQISGGIDYFRGASGAGFDDMGSFYCDPTLTTCLEDNVGGLGQVATLAELSRDSDPFDREVARVATLLIDAIDGPARVLPSGVTDQPSAGAFWIAPPTGGTLIPSTAFPTTDAMDEQVTLSGTVMPDTFQEMSMMGNTLNFNNFFGALARVARRSFSDAQVCDMFALHARCGMCTDIVRSEDLMAAPITPRAPLIVAGSVTLANRGSWRWTDMSSIATGYAIELVRGDGTVTLPRTPRSYGRSDTFSRATLDFDTQFTFRVATTNGSASSPFAEHTIHTFAEPVETAMATPLPGAAQLSWNAVRATEFTVHDVTGGIDRVVARTTGTMVTIRGLAGGVERTYRIVAHNAIGLPSAPSAPVRVTPLTPRVLFAATFGDDTHSEAGSAARPFRTIRAALVRAAEIDADEIILHEGTFYETGPLAIAETITLRGGYRLAAGTWEDVGGHTEISVSGGEATSRCITDSFNAGARMTSAAVIVRGGAVFSMLDLELTASRGAVPAGRCFAAIDVSDADLTIERGTVSVTASAFEICSTGITASDTSTVELRESVIRGAAISGTSIAAGMNASGVALCSGAGLTTESSSVVGVDAPLVTSSSIGSITGIAGNEADVIRIQRSRIEAMMGAYSWHATGGRLGGIQLTANGRVFIGNSIVRTPHGGEINRAVDVGSGSAALASLSLYHVTAAIGEDWDASEPVPLPFDGAVVALRGDIRDIAMFNNLFAYAGGGVDRVMGTVMTGIDRARTTADPLTLAFVGNAISVPFVSNWHLASLMQCRPLQEFGGLVRTEGELNTSLVHECHGGHRANWQSARNAAFTSAPGMGARAVIELMSDGYPVDSARAFVVGEPPSSVPLASEIALDFDGRARSFPPGVGAWAPR